MYRDELLTYITYYTGDVMASEDILHDVFVKFMEMSAVIENSVKSLLFSMTKRMIIDIARHKAIVRKVESRISVMERECKTCYIVNQMDYNYLKDKENECLSSMPDKMRRVYNLYIHEERSTDEIVSELGVTRRSVEGYIYRSRIAMREYIMKVV